MDITGITTWDFHGQCRLLDNEDDTAYDFVFLHEIVKLNP